MRSPSSSGVGVPGVRFDWRRARSVLGRCLRELVGLFEGGVLEVLPVRAWDMRRAPEAFRFMSQARHVGKIVLTLPRGVGPGPFGVGHGWHGCVGWFGRAAFGG